MVLGNNKILFRGLTLFVVLTLLFSCEDIRPVSIDCNECLSFDPQYAKVNITLNYSDMPVIVSVYSGYLEDNELFATFNIVSETKTSIDVAVNKRYTVTATYKVGDKTYIAVDSVMPKVLFNDSSCENVCYYIYNNDIDLSLKY